MKPRPVVLFDGTCNLCGGIVRWIVEVDRRERFEFVPLQTEAGQEALARLGGSTPGIDSIVLIDSDGAHTRSDAVLRIASRLDFPWSMLAWGRVAPRPIRDWAYSFVARNRYRWFGRR